MPPFATYVAKRACYTQNEVPYSNALTVARSHVVRGLRRRDARSTNGYGGRGGVLVGAVAHAVHDV